MKRYIYTKGCDLDKLMVLTHNGTTDMPYPKGYTIAMAMLDAATDEYGEAHIDGVGVKIYTADARASDMSACVMYSIIKRDEQWE